MSIEKTENVVKQPEVNQEKTRIRLRINQSNMITNYANSFRPVTSADEVLIDFGINQTIAINEPEKNGPKAEIIFDVSDRVIMNYSTAKRLTIAMNQVISNYEKEFGEIKLNAADRKIKR
jgi:Protein of unknown function (DUF3467)